MELSWIPFYISFKLALLTTVTLFIIGLPVAYWMAFNRRWYKPIAETIVTLPIILPPTVLGFYLLIILSPNSFLGRFLLDNFNISLVFNFWGMLIASCFYSMPFMIQPIKNGIEKIDSDMIDASYILGKSKSQTLWKVILPNMKPSIITALVTTFAHTIGEFGVVLMIGGNISSSTKVISIAIYEKVEELDFGAAHVYSGILLALSFTVLLTVNFVNRKMEMER